MCSLTEATVGMKTLQNACLVALGLGISGVLQGCGGGGSPTPAPPPGPTVTVTTTTLTTVTTTTLTTITTTTTSTLHARSLPVSAAETAAMLNKLYMGFDPKDDTSPLGVTISMAADPYDFTKNLFCSPEVHTKCFNGFADCRMSATLYNHKIVLQADKKHRPEMGLGRGVGFVFNQTVVETKVGKCAYVFDGATQSRYNYGCGIGNGNSDCKSGQTAFDNICPSTGKTCTGADDEVTRIICAPYGPMPVPEAGTDGQCYFPMPALNYPEAPADNHLRAMAKMRLREQVTQNGTDAKGPKISEWNELILDEHLLIPAIAFDPATVIAAFVYVKSNGAARNDAFGMRDKFSEHFTVGKIPVIGIDDIDDFTKHGGPFFDPSAVVV